MTQQGILPRATVITEKRTQTIRRSAGLQLTSKGHKTIHDQNRNDSPQGSSPDE